MYDLFSWGMNLLQGLIVGIASGLFLFYVVLPKIGAKTATQTLHAAKKDPEIGPLIAKAQEILHALEPLAKFFKNFDLEKMQKDIQPIIEVLKKIDPKDIDDLLKEIKSLTGTIKQNIAKPKIPEPTEPTQ
jgi:hypothetical protein